MSPPFFLAQKKCAPCHISWTYADTLHTFSWRYLLFAKQKRVAGKLDLRLLATRFLQLYCLFFKKSNKIFLALTHQTVFSISPKRYFGYYIPKYLIAILAFSYHINTKRQAVCYMTTCLLPTLILFFVYH